jgi:hypothetical protein
MTNFLFHRGTIERYQGYNQCPNLLHNSNYITQMPTDILQFKQLQFAKSPTVATDFASTGLYDEAYHKPKETAHNLKAMLATK